MIRRIVWYGDRGLSVVMWALVAATFALSVRYFATHTLAARAAEAASTVAEQAVEVQSRDAGRGAS
jgi:hypothetical protein